ncbi:hypothetical protein STENM223S_04782 [Streptomyces tendae]
MRSFTPRTRLATVSALTALGAFASLGTATAADPALNGEWAPFARCPVDAPAMLAADGFEKTPQCVVSTSAGGSVKLGDTTVVTGKHQVSRSASSRTPTAPAVWWPRPAARWSPKPATVPGGLLGLMCPSAIPVITGLCESLENSSLNKITATMESVGAPYDFDQTAGVLTDMPIVALPVRIHLENPLLGNKCYIGTAANPIVLLPENRNYPDFAMTFFQGDGTLHPAGEMSRIDLTGATQNDSTFGGTRRHRLPAEHRPINAAGAEREDRAALAFRQQQPHPERHPDPTHRPQRTRHRRSPGGRGAGGALALRRQVKFV